MKHLLLIGFFCTSALFAQEELTVSGAIDKALSNNYQIKTIKANYEISQIQNSWGMAGMVPTFGVSLGNNTGLQDNSNNPASFFPGVVLNDNLQATLDMNWTIFSGFGIRINKARFDQLQEQTKGNAIVVIESTIYDVIIAYYSAVTQERKLGIMEDMLDFSQKKLAYFEIKEDFGVSTSIDLLEFKNQVLTDSTNLILQRLNYRNALRNLNLVMGEDTEVLYNLTDEIAFEIPNSTYEDLKTEMIADNVNLKNQYINYELQDLNIQSQKAAYYPTVSLSLGTTPSVGYIQLFGDQGFSTSTNSWSHSANINVRYTIFNGYQRKKNVQIAEIQKDITAMEIEDLKLNLSHQLKGLFELYQTQALVEAMSKQRVENANLLWSTGVDKYDMGLINVFNLNDIKIAFEQAVLSYYDRLLDVLKTHYDLMRITGQITQQYQVESKVEE